MIPDCLLFITPVFKIPCKFNVGLLVSIVFFKKRMRLFSCCIRPRANDYCYVCVLVLSELSSGGGEKNKKKPSSGEVGGDDQLISIFIFFLTFFLLKYFCVDN